jgi:hypothetical protein
MVATVIGFSVPLTYNYRGSLPCNGCTYLLERIQASDIDFKPHPDLLAEMSRLQALESQTMTRWCVSDDRYVTLEEKKLGMEN